MSVLSTSRRKTRVTVNEGTSGSGGRTRRLMPALELQRAVALDEEPVAFAGVFAGDGGACRSIFGTPRSNDLVVTFASSTRVRRW